MSSFDYDRAALRDHLDQIAHNWNRRYGGHQVDVRFEEPLGVLSITVRRGNLPDLTARHDFEPRMPHSPEHLEEFVLLKIEETVDAIVNFDAGVLVATSTSSLRSSSSSVGLPSPTTRLQPAYVTTFDGVDAILNTCVRRFRSVTGHQVECSLDYRDMYDEQSGMLNYPNRATAREPTDVRLRLRRLCQYTGEQVDLISEFDYASCRYTSQGNVFEYCMAKLCNMIDRMAIGDRSRPRIDFEGLTNRCREFNQRQRDIVVMCDAFYLDAAIRFEVRRRESGRECRFVLQDSEVAGVPVNTNISQAIFQNALLKYHLVNLETREVQLPPYREAIADVPPPVSPLDIQPIMAPAEIREWLNALNAEALRNAGMPTRFAPPSTGTAQPVDPVPAKPDRPKQSRRLNIPHHPPKSRRRRIG